MSITSSGLSGAVKAAGPNIGKGLTVDNAKSSNTRMVFTSEELRQISAAINRDFAPVIKKRVNAIVRPTRFTPSELLEVSSWVSQFYSPKPYQTKGLFLLPIDPKHVYVYWDMSSLSPTIANNIEWEQGLTVKVYPAAAQEAIAGQEQASPVFQAPVAEQMPYRQMITLPTNRDPIAYVAVIAERRPDQTMAMVSHSNVANFHWQTIPARQDGWVVTPTQSALMPQPPVLSSAQPLNASGKGDGLR